MEELARILTLAGLRVVPKQDARGAQWTKLIFNAAVNPIGALTLLPLGAATRFAPVGALCEALVQEGESVARALGVILHGDARQTIAGGAGAPAKRK